MIPPTTRPFTTKTNDITADAPTAVPLVENVGPVNGHHDDALLISFQAKREHLMTLWDALIPAAVEFASILEPELHAIRREASAFCGSLMLEKSDFESACGWGWNPSPTELPEKAVALEEATRKFHRYAHQLAELLSKAIECAFKAIGEAEDHVATVTRTAADLVNTLDNAEETLRELGGPILDSEYLGVDVDIS